MRAGRDPVAVPGGEATCHRDRYGGSVRPAWPCSCAWAPVTWAMFRRPVVCGLNFSLDRGRLACGLRAAAARAAWGDGRTAGSHLAKAGDPGGAPARDPLRRL